MMMRPSECSDPAHDDDPSDQDQNIDPDAPPNYAEICIAGRDLTEFNATRFGSFIRRIDLSFNLLTKIRGLGVCAGSLEELVLDNNQLEQIDLSARFPKLHTITLNKNRIWNLGKLLKELSSRTDGLRFLSLLGNPACPDQLTSDLVDEKDYQTYRGHVLFHLPALRFLDTRPVTPEELKDSRRTSYAHVKIRPSFSPLPNSVSTRSTGSSPENESSSATESGSGAKAPPPTRPPKGRQGRRRFKYVGKNSEGNRFIKDSDL